MAPTPQNCPGVSESLSVPRPLPGDEVVITGMSGIFPSSDSVQEFKDNLYNKVDMVSSKNTRWDFDHPEVPDHLGIISGMDKFDAQFFRVHYKQAVTLEPTCRKMLEHAYSAIFDAGVNPVELRGKKVGVFIGASISESEKVVQYETIQVDGFGITGTNKSMFANRISYWLDAKGPSYAVDAACASSLTCIEHAYRSIISGHCESAIVGGCNLCLQPFIELNMHRVGFLCSDGKTKCFDKHGDGFVRADTISVLFLQRAKDAKRIYSEVYHSKVAYSLTFGDAYLPMRKPSLVKEFLNDFYDEINVSPADVEYVEAYAPGITDADRDELQAISQVYCREKHNPLLVGCVKSNMGNSEPASGVCSITKVCLAYHEGVIPANLHYSEPCDVDALKEGKIQVVTNNTPFNRGYTALNSFSYTGTNVHVLLKGHYKEKDLDRYNSNIPYLITVSGRQESCVANLLKTLASSPVDPEAIGLLHGIHKTDISGHTCRGYTLLTTDENNETISLSQSIEYSPGVTRPIWFVYSGMGSQWAGMGKELMRIPIFSAAIERCRKALEPKGVDLINILTNPDKTIYDNILNSFVGIAAVQIGLTDVLKELGIVPDNIIGHSVGELGCAYADGCFTTEEMILSAYSRGLVSIQTPFIRGSMAAVGLGYKAVLPLLPNEIEVACHNSGESSTISGPADVMKKFVADLVSRGIFAKEVPCSNIAYHSRYIADAGPGLLKYLNDVIKHPKPRSEKWLSTSVPQDKWSDAMAKYSSAEYHTNNLLNSVLFEETSKFIPSNAILIEIAPHGLLQAILKRALPDTCVHLPLTRRGHADPIKFILEAVGKMYQTGLNPKVDALYPPIEFPVSTETPLLSHLVEWEHSETWTLATFNKKVKVKAASREFVISVHDDDHKYLEDHIREGLNVYPEAGILVRVWETLGLLVGVPYEDLSVTFHNVRFHGEAILRKDVPLILNIEIFKGSQYFEVSCDDVCIASGNIFAHKKFFHRKLDEIMNESDEVALGTEDVYKIFKFKGYAYGKHFQTIRSTNVEFSRAQLKWDDEWTTFIDGLIQLNALRRNHNGVSVINFIQKLSIDVKRQYIQDKVRNTNEQLYYDACVQNLYSSTRCGGVDIVGETYTDKAVVENELDASIKREFVPYFPLGTFDIDTALRIILQIVMENVTDNSVKVTELVNDYVSTSISSALKNVVETIGQPNVYLEKNNDENEDLLTVFNTNENISKSNLLIVDNLLSHSHKKVATYKNLRSDQFVLTFEPDTTSISSKYTLFDVITAIKVEQWNLLLIRKSTTEKDNIVFLTINKDFNYSWLPQITEKLKSASRLLLVSEAHSNIGSLGTIKALRSEFKDKLNVMMIEDTNTPPFNQNNVFYKEQLNKNLCCNIFKKGHWGGYYYFPATSNTNLQNVTLTSIVPGDLDCLTWVEASLPPPSSNNNRVQVHYAGVSFRDVQRADGKILVTDVNNENQYGMDFSGINHRGQRIMGVISGGSVSSTIEADPDLLWPVPEHWSLEDAATVPLAYIQAFYCLVIRSEIFDGAKVLIHGGAGALGQAAISIALSYNCRVFTTVSDVRKKRFLLKLFPQLNDSDIGNSRDESFEALVLSATKGEGCDFAISCLNGLLGKATIRCCGLRGKILLVSHKEMYENNTQGMSALEKERTYSCISVSSIFKPEFNHNKKLLQKLVHEGISKGYVRPLTRVFYKPSEVSRAFRLLAASRNYGRVLIRIKDSNRAEAIESLPRLSITTQSTNIVVCDQQELGIELADRLVKRGARNILLHIKADFINGYLYTKMLLWKKIGVTIKLTSEDLETLKGCENLLHTASEIGPVEGIFVTVPANEPESKKWNRDDDITDKRSAVLNLDICTRQLCKNLKYFAILHPKNDGSSVTNFICQKRADDGFPALSLQYETINKDIKPQKISSILNTMESSLRLNRNVVVGHNVNNQRASNFHEKIARILCVNELEEIPEYLHLDQVEGVENINIDEITNVLKKDFNIIYAKEKLEKLTMKEFKKIPFASEETLKKQRLNGLDAFIGYVDPDEYQATQPIVPMRTKLSNSCDLVDEIDKRATYLMLIPGYEGHHRIFHKVCERLKIQAVTLQLEPDYIEETVKQTARRIFKMIRKRFELNSKFYILGYSFGVIVALEVAALLEEDGLIGTVFCLDSSPDVLRSQLETYLGDLNRTMLQNSIIEHMYRLMKGDDLKKLQLDLARLNEWSEKVEACVENLRSVVSYSNQYKRFSIEMVYKRIEQGLRYQSLLKPLRSKLVLLKSRQGQNNFPQDYGLSKYSQQAVIIYDLELDHAWAPQDLRCSNIINANLDSDLLEEFKQNFTCDIYCADQENLF